MSLLDLIRPQWKHSNSDVRLEAVLKLGAENQEIFTSIVQNDKSPKVRLAAVRKISSTSVLRSLLQDSDADIRQLAGSRVQDELARILRNHEGALTEEVRNILAELKNTQLIEDVLRNARSSEVRRTLVKQCGKYGLLAQVALRDNDESVALDALKLVDRENLLQDIADHSRHPAARVMASDRLREKDRKASAAVAKAQAAAPVEDPTLKPKRAAVLSHAQRLLDTRDILANETEFLQVLAEAQSLGMGPVQADFDRVASDFTSRVEQVRAQVEQESKAAAARANAQESLQILVIEFEGLVNEGSAELVNRLGSVQARWRELNGDQFGELSKRFYASLSRAQRVQQQAQQAEFAQADSQRTQQQRGEVLEQLKLLLEKEDLDSVERQLRGLVREWESLPLLEGEDPNLQNYNRLRDSMKERLNSRDEQYQKAHEENMAKLNALIERVKTLDENQDFKEISKILRQTYLEWKDIVGDDKYKYHEVWKEYRAATARFEEMKEWESWRNEQERDHLIKEIEGLLVLEDAPDALGKLRHFQMAWKDAGFVPQPKLQELWDRYKAVTEQVMAKFHDYIEEQNVQKQKNLDAKIAMCEEVDRIVADTSDQWKEKARRVQQLQDDWKQAGPVPREQNQPIWDRFRAVCDAFYVKHKEYLSKEDGERQINLQKKIVLCEQAESIKESDDWNGTTNRLRKLQEDWKSVGPVPKSQSEEIWTRFRSAADAFFTRKREHFDEVDKEKSDNYAKKVALCEKLETMDLDPSKSEICAAVEAIEGEWKSIGMVPKEQVDELWNRYCILTDRFLESKALQDAELRAELAKRTEAKQGMIDKVRELSDDAGSNQTSDMVRQLQDDWKQIGRSGSKEQDLYHKFREVCDEFFERRRDQLEIQEQARKNNLQRKILLIEQAERIQGNENLGEESLEEVKHLRRLWKEVGAVPREHSDKIWKRFNTACDAVFLAVRGEKPLAPAERSGFRNDRGVSDRGPR